MEYKRHYVLYGVLALSVIGLLLWSKAQAPGEVSFTPQIQSEASTIASSTRATLSTFEIVDSPDERARGLSGRRSVPQDYGMLFVFDTPGNYGFWMKDMFVSIDILWLANDGTILAIEDSVSPSTYPKSFHPPKPVKFVLELRAGEARRLGWGIGTQIALPEPYSLPRSQ
jgi:uncharacterized protein